jgi:hypothetical protein
MFDTISYNEKSLNLPRAVAAGAKIDPLKLAGQGFTLHPSYTGLSNVDQRLISFVENSTTPVLASIEMITQGQLPRPGVDNDPMSTTAKDGKRVTLLELEKDGLFEGVIEIPKQNTSIRNTFIKSGRPNVRLKRDKNSDKGTERVEVKATKLKDLNGFEQVKDAKKIIKDILSKALKGTLPLEYKEFLLMIINRRKYTIIPLANTLLLVDGKKFSEYYKDVATAQDILTAEEIEEALYNLTSIDELLESDLNIDSLIEDETFDWENHASNFPKEVASLIENYPIFVKSNLTTSVTSVKIGDKIEGVNRVNKRIIITMDKSFSELNNEFIKQEPVSKPDISGSEWNDINLTSEEENNIIDNLNIEC